MTKVMLFVQWLLSSVDMQRLTIIMMRQPLRSVSHEKADDFIERMRGNKQCLFLQSFYRLRLCWAVDEKGA